MKKRAIQREVEDDKRVKRRKRENYETNNLSFRSL